MLAVHLFPNLETWKAVQLFEIEVELKLKACWQKDFDWHKDKDGACSIKLGALILNETLVKSSWSSPSLSMYSCP